MVADFDASDDCLDIESTQRWFIGTQVFTYQLGGALDRLGRDSAFRVCEVPTEHGDIGLNMDKLFAPFAMLVRVRTHGFAVMAVIQANKKEPEFERFIPADGRADGASSALFSEEPWT